MQTLSYWLSHFGFLIFIGAMAVLALMPPAEPRAPSPKPEGAKPEGKANNENEEKWRRMSYLSDAKWRRMLMMMHLRREQQPAQPPIQINIVAPESMLPGREPTLIENNGETVAAETAAAADNSAAKPTSPPGLGARKFRLPRPRLNALRPRVAATRQSNK